MATKAGVPGYPARTGVEDLRPPAQKPMVTTWKDSYRRLRWNLPSSQLLDEWEAQAPQEEPEASKSQVTALISPNALVHFFGENVMLAVFGDGRIGVTGVDPTVARLSGDREQRQIGTLQFSLLSTEELIALVSPPSADWLQAVTKASAARHESDPAATAGAEGAQEHRSDTTS